MMEKRYDRKSGRKESSSVLIGETVVGKTGETVKQNGFFYSLFVTISRLCTSRCNRSWSLQPGVSLLLWLFLYNQWFNNIFVIILTRFDGLMQSFKTQRCVHGTVLNMMSNNEKRRNFPCGDYL